MDFLMRKEDLDFTIDEIIPISEDLFILRIMPNIESEFFPPFHLRYIKVSYKLLEKKLYKSFFPESEKKDFKETVIQGGYYKIPTKDTIKSMDLFNVDKTIIDNTNDIFKEYMKESPFDEKNINGEKTYKGERSYEYLQESKIISKQTYIYCFNVGQGDSMLLITSSGNAYLIDSNCHDTKKATKFTDEINKILQDHNIINIKGLIVTHKHIDHLRGLKHIIDQNYLNIENFIINQDYIHSTKAVIELFYSAQKIPVWHNLNTPGIIKEGKTVIHFLNPDHNTANKNVEANINNSSITMFIKHDKTTAYLTGDLGSSVISNKFNSQNISKKNQSVLKVSHHGSSNGTNNHILNLLNPSHAFISAGTNKNYKHPDSSVVNLIKTNNINLKVSKVIKKTICYQLDSDYINII